VRRASWPCSPSRSQCGRSSSHVANKLSRESNTIAEGSNALSRESNDIAREALQHSARGVELAEASEQERARQTQARAVMEADISPLIHTVQASESLFRPLVRVRNVGQRDSGRVIVRVYMPAGRDLMAWDDEHTKPDRTRPIEDPDVKFHDLASGASTEAQYIDRTVDNVTPTMPVEFRVILPVPIPQAGQTSYRIPVHVVVRADQADDTFEWTDYVQTTYGPPG
jgi:hypothetical protein